MENKKRILTGDRTTGKLHLGHYIGSLQNRAKLQDEYDTFILLADIQALTTHFENPQLINDSILQVALDNLAVGLDPEKVTFVQQSQITSIAELTVMFSMFVPVNRLEDNPTIKTEAKQYGYKGLTYGFLGYPVSQSADILFCQADLVPVGEDQKPHMEETRRIVRRFNMLYGEVFHEPRELLSICSRLKGIDGNEKMGKSLGNAIYLSENAQDVAKKIMSAKTDPARIAKTDPGHPDICTAFAYHKAFNTGEADNICEMCKKGSIGCVACKKNLANAVNMLLDPIRERRAYYEGRLNEVKEIIQAGSDKANEIGNQTVKQAKDAMSLLLK